MSRFQSSPLGKLVASLLLLVLTFLCGTSAFSLLSDLPYLEADNWQGTARYYNLLYHREDDLIRATALTLTLEDENSNLTYVERQQIENELAVLETAMSPENTNFRIVKPNNGNWRYTYTSDNEQEVIQWINTKLNITAAGA